MRYRDNRTKMAWPQSPQMEIGHLIALGFDHLTQLLRHALIGISTLVTLMSSDAGHRRDLGS